MALDDATEAELLRAENCLLWEQVQQLHRRLRDLEGRPTRRDLRPVPLATETTTHQGAGDRIVALIRLQLEGWDRLRVTADEFRRRGAADRAEIIECYLPPPELAAELRDHADRLERL